MIGPRNKVIVFTLFAAMLRPASVAAGDTARKIRNQVQPVMSEMARHMNLKGTVRLEVEIAQDGSVKSVKALGGHPVLIQSAEEAVRKWRYEPGPPTKTVVEFNFHQD